MVRSARNLRKFQQSVRCSDIVEMRSALTTNDERGAHARAQNGSMLTFLFSKIMKSFLRTKKVKSLLL